MKKIAFFGPLLCVSPLLGNYGGVPIEKSQVRARYSFETGASERQIVKLEFEDHTYLVLKNSWSSAGDCFLHDPNCRCFKEQEKR